MSPSSTSSSEPRERGRRRLAIPWVGLATLLLLLAADRWAMAPTGGLWKGWEEEARRWPPKERGIVFDRWAFRRLHEAGPDAATAVMIGNSRAAAALRFKIAERKLPGWTFGLVAHAGLELFEMLSAAERLQPLDVDVGLLAVSEFDLFRDQLPRTDSGLCRWPALGTVARLVGPTGVFEHRQRFLQLTASCTIETYGVRSALDQGGLGEWTEIDRSIVARRPKLVGGTETITPTQSGPGSFFPVAARSEADDALRARRERLLDEAVAAFPDRPASSIRQQALHAVRLHRGPHVAYNRRLLERVVDVFLDSGNRVLLVEPPLHSSVRRALDPSMRRDFLRWAEELARRDGVDFLPLESSGPFEDSELADLTHLHNTSGAIRMTASIAYHVGRMPLPDDARPAEASSER